MKVDRSKRWWGFLNSREPIPEPETKAQENFRRTFLKQVAGSVLVAGGVTKAGRNILESVEPGPGAMSGPIRHVGHSAWPESSFSGYMMSGGFGTAYGLTNLTNLTNINDGGTFAPQIKRGVRRG